MIWMLVKIFEVYELMDGQKIDSCWFISEPLKSKYMHRKEVHFQSEKYMHTNEV